MIPVRNLLARAPQGTAGELIEEILKKPDLRIERIVSHGEASPTDFWYDQADDEWVLLLAGRATLRFADGQVAKLRPGDHLLIPRRCRHRVDWTDPEAETVWLAVHLAGADPS